MPCSSPDNTCFSLITVLMHNNYNSKKRTFDGATATCKAICDRCLLFKLRFFNQILTKGIFIRFCQSILNADAFIF